MTRRVASAALSAVLLVLAVVTGLSVTASSASAATTVAAAHTSPVTHGSERRPGAALSHLAVDRQAPGWAPLDPPQATATETAWSPGDFAAPDLVHVAGLSIVTEGPALHQGRAPPAGAASRS